MRRLTRWFTKVAPSKATIMTLGARDVDADGRQSYALLLEYGFKQLEAGEVSVRGARGLRTGAGLFLATWEMRDPELWVSWRYLRRRVRGRRLFGPLPPCTSTPLGLPCGIRSQSRVSRAFMTGAT